MRISLLAGAIALLATTTAAHAGTHVGWYVAADAGIHQPSKLNLTIDDVSLYSRDFDPSTDPEVPAGPVLSPAESKYSQGLKGGAAGFLRGGYQFTPHWRMEAELGDRESKIKRTLLDGDDNDSGATGAGHVNIDTAMVNVLYDFAPNSKIDPFVGLGAGQAHIKSSYRGQVDVNDDGDTVTTSYRLNNNARNSAWQFLAGFSWALSDRLNLDVTYRYLDAGKMRYKVTANATYTAFDCNFDEECCDDECCDGPCGVENQVRAATVAAEAPPGMVSVDETDIITASTRRLHDQSLSVGLRWAFAAPPPPAPIVSAAAPPPPPEPSVPPPPQVDNSYGPQENGPAPQTFTVYFAFDRANLSDTAMQVINSAAAYAKTGASPSVTVTGHTDTAGSNAYNVALSMRRANAVAQGLVNDGVDSGAIKTGWTGEKDLAVPTGNSTPNPENRRTTIDVAF